MDCRDETTVDLDSGLECMLTTQFCSTGRELCRLGAGFRRENISQLKEHCLQEHVPCPATLLARSSEWGPGGGIAETSSIPIVLYCRGEDNSTCNNCEYKNLAFDGENREAHCGSKSPREGRREGKLDKILRTRDLENWLTTSGESPCEMERAIGKLVERVADLESSSRGETLPKCEIRASGVQVRLWAQRRSLSSFGR